MLRRFYGVNKFRLFNFIFAALVLIPFTLSCSQQEEKEPEEKFHEVKDYLVKYDLQGATEGTKVLYSQDWGKCVMQIVNNKKTISSMEDGEQYVISVDMETKTGTKMLNPIYKSLIESLGAKTPKEFNLALLNEMGGKVVGSKTVIGNECEVWELMEGMQQTCITEDGIVLYSESNIRGVERGEIATELIRGSKEGVDACDPGDAEIEVIDIGQMLQQQGSETLEFELNPKENSTEESNQQEKSKEETTE